MKKLYVLLILHVCVLKIHAQTWSYEFKMDNFRQVNETEFQFDLSLRKGTGSSDFALHSMACRWSFSEAILNGGSFQNGYLTLVGGSTPTGTGLFQKPGWFSDNDFTMVGPSQLEWNSAAALPGNGDPVTVIDATWRKVAGFSVKLRNTGNTAMLNFADADPQFAFESSGAYMIVRRCDAYTGSNPTAAMSGTGFTEISPAGRVAIPATGAAVNTRKLAGFCFTGTGNYSSAVNWNNVTTSNYHTVPGTLNNAIIAGAATISDSRTSAELTVATGGYLVIESTGKFTTGNLFNDNLTGVTGPITLAGWDFENSNLIDLPYTADFGTSNNIESAIFSTTATFEDFYTINNGTRAPVGLVFRAGSGTGTQRDWRIQLSSSGYQNIKISSTSWSDNLSWRSTVGPTSFNIQWSLNGSTWTDVSSGTVTVANNWTTGVVSNLPLPSNLNDQSTIYIRWRTNAPDKTKNGYTSIDDIIVTGEPLPSGITIRSASGSTGSLIHNNAGVSASVGRYIGGWTDANHGWHFLSSPADAQPISAFHTPGSGNDFYQWDEGAADGNKWINRTGPDGQLNPAFETNFAVGSKGYLIANASVSTPAFSGVINVADVPVTGLSNHSGTPSAGWHLLGNPFSSAISFNQGNWNRINVSPKAQIWNEATASYKVISGAMEIPAMNGFMVYTTGNGSLNIPTNARLHSDSGWYKQSGTDDRILLVAHDPEGNTSQETAIAFDNRATDGFDAEFDSYFIPGFAPAFYSRSGNADFAWNTIPVSSGEGTTPLIFTKNGSPSFNITLERTIPGVTVVLKDLKLNQEQILSTNPVYSFSSSPEDDPDRFRLSFRSNGMNDHTTNRPVSIYSIGYTIYIMANNARGISGTVRICNMAGIEIMSQVIREEIKTAISCSYSRGLYLVTVSTAEGIYTEKIIIH